jgi:P27 family predicted phage terminase small subunit
MPQGRQRGTGLPTALKILKGGHPERVNRDEPVPDDAAPVCPSADPAVREVWEYTLGQLQQMKTISAADRDMLHAYCEQVVLYREAARLVHEEGLVILGATGVVKHPAIAVMQNAGALMARHAAAFGLTPQGRSAIRVGDQRAAVTVQSSAPAARLLSS